MSKPKKKDFQVKMPDQYHQRLLLSFLLSASGKDFIPFFLW